MRTLIRCIRSDIHKFRHTPMLWIHILIPLSAALLFAAYYSISSWEISAKISGYLEVIGVAFPLMIGLITGMAAEQEEQAGNFQTMLCGVRSRAAAYTSKLLLLLLLGTLSIVIALGTFAVGFQAAPAMLYVRAGGLLMAGSIFLYILHLFVSLRYGKGLSVGLGIAESLISALALTGLGDGKWYYIPCAWSARLCDNLVFTWLFPSTALGHEEIHRCLIIAACAAATAFIISLFWFDSWEGGKPCE